MLRSSSSLHAVVIVLLAGCIGDPVGSPCIPESVPPNGFLASETYLETNSAQCETRLCMVRGLDGDPRSDCEGEGCAPRSEVHEHVYCTRSCTSDDGCPDGFECADLGALGRSCARAWP